LVIPAATIARVPPALLADGHVARGWLGVGLQPVAVRLLRAGELRTLSLLVTARPAR
jgi:S1-C subfamily serine protease